MTATWTDTAVPEAVPKMRNRVADFAITACMVDPPLADVRLAVSEAVTNAVMHSYVSAAEPGEVDVTASISDRALVVVVGDHGGGMRPRTDSPGLGLGLPLISMVADVYEVRPREPRGTEVHMCFEF